MLLVCEELASNMQIHDANDGILRNKKRKRIGRGLGSGHGKTAGKGSNGHKSRSGYSMHPAFQGGQLEMIRRIPKRGFNNKFAPNVFPVNVGDIDAAFEANAEVTPEKLKECGLAKVVFDEIKVLGDGNVTKPLKLIVTRISEVAKQKIEAAGGSVQIVPAKRTPDERVEALKQAAGNK